MKLKVVDYELQLFRINNELVRKPSQRLYVVDEGRYITLSHCYIGYHENGKVYEVDVRDIDLTEPAAGELAHILLDFVGRNKKEENRE